MAAANGDHPACSTVVEDFERRAEILVELDDAILELGARLTPRRNLFEHALVPLFDVRVIVIGSLGPQHLAEGTGDVEVGEGEAVGDDPLAGRKMVVEDLEPGTDLG